MDKTIIRIKKQNNFFIASKAPLEDVRLSWKAKGLLAYLLTLPDDWKIYVEELSKHSKDGTSSTTTAIKELMENGYIRREKIRNSKGQFKGYIYRVYETIQIKKTETGKTENGESVLVSTDNDKNNTTNNNITNNNLIINNITKKEEELDKDLEEKYKNCISANISKFEKEELINLQNIIGTEILKKAILISCLKNGKNIDYLKSTILDWKNKNLDTIEKVENYLEEWKSKNKEVNRKRKQKIEQLNNNKFKNGFNNFEARSYDYEKLERKLLGWEE